MTVAERLMNDVFGDTGDIFERMRQWTGQSQPFLPAADLYETGDEFVVEMDVPGLDADTISAEVVDGRLVIAGERQPAQAQRFFSRERWVGRFVRTFALSRSVDGDAISAGYENGVLLVRIPKPEETKPKRITIGTGQKQLSS